MGKPKSEPSVRKVILPGLDIPGQDSQPALAIPPPSCLEVFFVSATEYQRVRVLSPLHLSRRRQILAGGCRV